VKLPETVAWTGDGVRVLDQTLLPEEVSYKVCRTVEECVEAIRALRVRGAPAIGVMAAYSLALAMKRERPENRQEFLRLLREHEARIARARPTAVNLAWALRRSASVVESSGDEEVAALDGLLVAEAGRIAEEDRLLCEGIGAAGECLVPEEGGVLTHCNAGALATAGIGTALAPLYLAWERGKRFHVYADETRPLLQGARLTAWELGQAGIPVTLLCDGAAPFLMAQGKVTMVIVGADRIAASGDVANKVGTYSLALAAAAHAIPFYVAAPSSTFDLSLEGGHQIPIEERGEQEVLSVRSIRVASEGARAWNPAFDLTPAELVTAFVTERGILRPPFGESIPEAFRHPGGEGGEGREPR
jgi:methylthioribose-1-phosphate isomerase